MTITLATGTQVAIATAFAASKTMSAVTNANPAVATLEASHGVIVGDFIEISSGWDLLDKKVVRVSAVNVNDVTLEGINTASTTDYPAGSGTGTIREVTTWTSITQIQDVSPSGQDLQYADVTTIADRTQKQMPTVRTPIQIDWTVFDDPSLAWYSTIMSISDSRSLAPLRIVFANASRVLLNGYLNLQKMPTIATNAPLTAKLQYSGACDPVRYAT